MIGGPKARLDSQVARRTEGAKWPFALLGMLVGGLACLFLTQAFAARSSLERSALSAPSAAGSAVPLTEESWRQRRRVALATPRLAPADEPGARAAAADRRTAPDPQRVIDAFNTKIEDHARESLDAAWARQTADAVGKGLAEVAPDSGFSVRNLDCRSHTCVAELEWPSFDAAAESYRLAATASFGQPCGTEIILPPTDRPEGAYRAKLHLICRR